MAAAAVADRLDVEPDRFVGAVTTLAGLDLGARRAEEIAVSILAQLLAHRRDLDGPASLEVADPDVTVRGSESGADGGEAARTPPVDGETVVDPVCGMEVTVGEAAARVSQGGETYHFCGAGCADAFKAAPGRYARRR